jgi:hypothetical protein
MKGTTVGHIRTLGEWPTLGELPTLGEWPTLGELPTLGECRTPGAFARSQPDINMYSAMLKNRSLEAIFVSHTRTQRVIYHDKSPTLLIDHLRYDQPAIPGTNAERYP